MGDAMGKRKVIIGNNPFICPIILVLILTGQSLFCHGQITFSRAWVRGKPTGEKRVQQFIEGSGSTGESLEYGNLPLFHEDPDYLHIMGPPSISRRYVKRSQLPMDPRLRFLSRLEMSRLLLKHPLEEAEGEGSGGYNQKRKKK